MASTSIFNFGSRVWFDRRGRETVYQGTNVPHPTYIDQLKVSPYKAAPEIDPASAASALTLLLGGLAVLRGRRAS